MQQLKETKVPHVKAMAIKKEAIKQLVCSMLKWTDDELSAFQFDAGVLFVDTLLHPLREDIDKQHILYGAVFWGWWRNRWAQRDQSLYAISDMNADLYISTHTDKLLKCELTITSFWSHVEAMMDDGAKSISKL